jgi:hypothetical protein
LLVETPSPAPQLNLPFFKKEERKKESNKNRKANEDCHAGPYNRLIKKPKKKPKIDNAH